jgi:fibro-slime domain-containing protein
MRPGMSTPMTKHCIPATIAGISLLLPPGVAAVSARTSGSPDTILLPGVVRDFHKDNPDLNVAPSAGKGHYAGNIAFGLGSDGRPVFVNAGYKVTKEWTNKDGHPIAPHMYLNGLGAPGTIPVTVASPSPKHGVLDTYDSLKGAYGGANVGSAPTYVVGAPMPAVVVPASVASLPSQGDLSYSGTATVSSDIHCDQLDISGTLKIAGNRTIVCEDAFALSTHAVVSLEPGASLCLFMKKGGSSWNHVVVGDNLNPSRVTIYNLGTTTFMIHNHAEVYAQIISPAASVEISNHGSLFGRFIGKTVEYDNHGDFHVDKGFLSDFCGTVIKDVAGTRGVDSAGGISSAPSFVKWFTDVLGTNMSARYSLELVRSTSGVYEHLTDQFHPVDNILFGNEGHAHNCYFTYAFQVEFTHRSCDDRFFEFEGTDDAWMFIDGRLAMDLGGLTPGTSQYVEMDRLNLVDGQTYTLHFFYAQRQASLATFRMRTNLDFVQSESLPYTITATGD